MVLDSVSKRFGDVTAVNDVSLQVGSGEIVGILGENGAGKSTLFSLINGVNIPSEGSVRLLGQNPRTVSTRRLIGVTPQGTGLDLKMRVDRFLQFVGVHFGTVDRVDELMDKLHLRHISRKIIGTLSGGQQRLVSIASAFIADAPLTLLDEPTTGLDTSTRTSVWDFIRSRRRENNTLIVTSHYIEEIEQLCERVIVLSKGTVIADSDTKSLAQISSSIISLSQVHDSMRDTIVDKFDVIDEVDRDITIRSKDIKLELDTLHRLGWPFDDIKISSPTLEQAFLQLTESKRG